MTRTTCSALTTLLIMVSSPTAPAHPPEVEAWPEADERLRGDLTWRGGDSAYSVDLGEGRVLWLFGDSFVGVGPGASRSGRTMVRNTVALQAGYDPASADVVFHVGHVDGEPCAVFPSNEPDTWLWPGPGLRVDGTLVLTFVRVGASEGGLGFTSLGAEAYAVRDVTGPVSGWDLEPLALPATPPGVSFGTGALWSDDDFVYAIVVVEPGNHDAYVARWPRAEFSQLGGVRWWGAEEWGSPDRATPIVHDLQTEFSVHRARDGWLWLVSVDGFGGANVVVRRARAPEGPWSEPEHLWTPPEAAREQILIYSAKAHPWAVGPQETVTYCTNHLDFWTLAGDMDLYWPRFLKVRSD